MQLVWDFSELDIFAANLQNTYVFDTAMMTATREIAKVLHKFLLEQTPVKTGNLRKMWSAGENLAFDVAVVPGGYMVTMINLAQNQKGDRYGIWVNDGHSTPSGNGWVMGRFFVEASLLQTENSTQLDDLIMKELQKWWRSV